MDTGDERVRRIGGIKPVDLTAALGQQGAEALLYPLLQKVVSDRATPRGGGRPADADLQPFLEWKSSHDDADIWLTCRVHHSDSAIPDLRILAHRSGEGGYLAMQNRDDLIEVFTLPATDLGPAIADQLELTEPGRRTSIVVPKYVDYFRLQSEVEYEEEDDDYGLRTTRSVEQRPNAQSVDTVSDDDVMAVITIQSRWQPARAWGIDWAKPVLVCLQLDRDGDYVYTSDFSYAEPLDRSTLSQRINGLVAEDILAIRRHRGITR